MTKALRQVAEADGKTVNARVDEAMVQHKALTNLQGWTGVEESADKLAQSRQRALGAER